MQDIYLIVATALFGALLVTVSFLIVLFYQHPDDYGSGYVYKVLIMLAFTLAGYLVLMVPLDVGSRNSTLTGADPFPMDLLWLIAFLAGVGVCIGLIPFFMHFYESDASNIFKKFCFSLIYEIVFVVVTVAVLALCYAFLGTVEVPIYKTTGAFVAAGSGSSNVVACASCQYTFFELPVRPTIAVYIVAFLSWIGWLIFIVLAGVGLTALPMDLINDFRTRPRDLGNSKAAQAKYIAMRTNLRERARVLMEAGKRLKDEVRSGHKLTRRQINQYRADVFRLDLDFDHFEFYNNNKRSAIFYVVRLILGILAWLVTLAWILQIVLFILVQPPVTGLLNDAFIAMDSVFPLFGTLFFCLFTFYLLWCVLKGVMKVGLRLLIISIHPMKFKGTRLNSLLFNAGLLIFACFPLIQFVSDAFASYARLTSVDVIFGVVARNLMFLKYFFRYNIYLYVLLGFAFLAFLFLLCCTGRKKRDKEMADEFQRLRDQKV